MSNLEWFKLPVQSIHRAVEFYSFLLGRPLEIEIDNDTKIATFRDENNNAYGCIFEESTFTPDMFGIMLHFNLPNINNKSWLNQIKELGGEVFSNNQETTLAGEYKALILDSEGNKLAIFNSNEIN